MPARRLSASIDDRRIRYYLSPDETPLGKARDSAIRQASGEWLAFIDQDDIWLPRKLEKQMALAGPSVGIIYGRAVLFDSSRGNLRDYDYAHEFQALPEGDIFTELFRHACFIAMSSAVLRRTAVEEIGGIPESIEITPDYFLYVALARRYQARAVQDVVCRYRLHSGSMLGSQRHRLRLQSEPLSVVNQWAGEIEPRVGAYRRNGIFHRTGARGDAISCERGHRTETPVSRWLFAVADWATDGASGAGPSAKITPCLLAEQRPKRLIRAAETSRPGPSPTSYPWTLACVSPAFARQFPWRGRPGL